MKNTFLVLLGLLFTSSIYAQNDKILGTWLNEKKDGKIEVYKKGNGYYGKIIWLKNDKNDDGTRPKTDSKNPDVKKRKRAIVGTNILTNLKWDASEKEYNDGEIYDPRGGSTYSCFAYIQKDGRLFIKGYIGFAIIGRSTLWTRVK